MRRNFDWLAVALLGLIAAITCFYKTHAIKVSSPTQWTNAQTEHFNHMKGAQDGWFVLGVMCLGICLYAMIRINGRRKRDRRFSSSRPMQQQERVSPIYLSGIRPARPTGELARRFADHADLPEPSRLADFSTTRPMPTRIRPRS